jgi:trimeric autotransporter adhesin
LGDSANNTAIGFQALHSSTGGLNTATGSYALLSNTTGELNTATGANALGGNTTGRRNTASGFEALGTNSIGIQNTALGYRAGINVTTASNVIAIGHPGLNNSNSCFIGNIHGINEGGPDILAVYVDSNGQLGTQPPPSSRRFKEAIKPMHSTSEAILSLKPVAFHYKSDTKGTLQFGLIAEDVAAVHPDLVVRDDNGDVYSVRYDAVNVMVLNEFLKEHRKVQEQEHRIQEQEAVIAELKKDVETLVVRVKEHDSRLQRVSDQVGMNKDALQVVTSEQ